MRDLSKKGRCYAKRARIAGKVSILQEFDEQLSWLTCKNHKCEIGLHTNAKPAWNCFNVEERRQNRWTLLSIHNAEFHLRILDVYGRVANKNVREVELRADARRSVQVWTMHYVRWSCKCDAWLDNRYQGLGSKSALFTEPRARDV